jgi:ammonium transporter Rh
MMFVGFGFLMVFLKKHCWSSVSFTMFLTVIAIQWTVLTIGFFEHVLCTEECEDERIKVNIFMLMRADLGAACCLISMGAILGKVNAF